VPEGSVALAELQAAIETVAAERAELQLRVRRGGLIEAERLKSGIIERAHYTRELLLLIAPVRQAAALAAPRGLDAGTLLTVLSRLMRSALFDISKGPPGRRNGA
jgi:hypothetical protein